MTGEKGAAKSPLEKERERKKDRTFGERGAKPRGGRVGKCAAARTRQGGGETAERNRTRFGLAVTFYQRRDALLPTKSKRRTRKIKKKRKGRRKSLLGTIASRRRFERLRKSLRDSLQNVRSGKAHASSQSSAADDVGDLERGAVPMPGTQGFLPRSGAVRSLLLLPG